MTQPDGPRWRYLPAADSLSDFQILGVTERQQRRPPESRQVSIPGSKWAWIVLDVYPPVEPEPYEVIGLGISEPGGPRVTGDVARSHTRSITMQRRGLMSAGGSIGGFLSAAIPFVASAPGLLVGAIGATGVAAGLAGALRISRIRRLVGEAGKAFQHTQAVRGSRPMLIEGVRAGAADD